VPARMYAYGRLVRGLRRTNYIPKESEKTFQTWMDVQGMPESMAFPTEDEISNGLAEVPEDKQRGGGLVVRDELAVLGTRDASIAWDCWIDGMPVPRAAVKYGLSRQWVHVVLNRSRERLQGIMRRGGWV